MWQVVGHILRVVDRVPQYNHLFHLNERRAGTCENVPRGVPQGYPVNAAPVR